VRGGGLEPFAILPTFMEGFEDMVQVRFGQPVEVGHHGVEFVDEIVLLVARQGPALNAYGGGPLLEAPILGGESACNLNDALP
jgi:hypothetical protein